MLPQSWKGDERRFDAWESPKLGSQTQHAWPSPVCRRASHPCEADRKYEIGRFPEAIADYRRAVALRATGPALVGLSRALYDSNKPAEALKALEQAIQTDGRYAAAWLLLGELHQGEGHKAQARAAYERFLQLESKGEQAAAVREIIAKQLK